jgi:cell division protein FtsQ
MNRTNAFLIPILFTLALSGMYIFISHSPRFCLTKVEVRGNRKTSEKEILEKAKIRLDGNIFRMDLGKIKDRVKEDSRIKEVRVKRQLPDRLLIEVEEKKPALWVNLPEGLCGLSKDQEIIPLEEEDFHCDLPIVTGLESPAVVGEQSAAPYQRWPDTRAKFVSDFWNSMLEEDSSFADIISEIDLHEKANLVLYLIPGAIQVNMGKGDFEKKLKRLKAVLNYQERTARPALIDLRFKDQVVLRESSPGSLLSTSQQRCVRSAQTKGERLGEKENL